MCIKYLLFDKLNLGIPWKLNHNIALHTTNKQTENKLCNSKYLKDCYSIANFAQFTKPIHI